MFVIADTTPLNYLIRLGLADLLPQFYGSVFIPNAVLFELGNPKAPSEVKAWLAALPAWLRVVSVKHLDDTLDPDLGLGELEAISLALEMKPQALLIDDQEARNAAELRGLFVTGTLAVLRDAASANRIDLATEVERLLALGFRAKASLIETLLKRP